MMHKLIAVAFVLLVAGATFAADAPKPLSDKEVLAVMDKMDAGWKMPPECMKNQQQAKCVAPSMLELARYMKALPPAQMAECRQKATAAKPEQQTDVFFQCSAWNVYVRKFQ